MGEGFGWYTFGAGCVAGVAATAADLGIIGLVAGTAAGVAGIIGVAGAGGTAEVAAEAAAVTRITKKILTLSAGLKTLIAGAAGGIICAKGTYYLSTALSRIESLVEALSRLEENVKKRQEKQ